MNDLTPEATLLWSDYLIRVRQSLSSLSDSEQNEVIDELESHLLAETVSVSKPVSEITVQAVMARLGTAEEIAEGYGITDQTQISVDRNCLILIVISLTSLCLALVLPAVALLAIPIAAITSRIALSNAALRDSHYRYAAYPGMWVGYLALMLVVLAWPLTLVLPLAATGGFLPQLVQEKALSLEAGSAEYWLLVWAVFTAITAIWWLCLARFIRRDKLLLSRIFYPFVTIQAATVSRLLNISAIALIGLALAAAIVA